MNIKKILHILCDGNIYAPKWFVYLIISLSLWGCIVYYSLSPVLWLLVGILSILTLIGLLSHLYFTITGKYLLK